MLQKTSKNTNKGKEVDHSTIQKEIKTSKISNFLKNKININVKEHTEFESIKGNFLNDKEKIDKNMNTNIISKLNNLKINLSLNNDKSLSDVNTTVSTLNIDKMSSQKMKFENDDDIVIIGTEKNDDLQRNITNKSPSQYRSKSIVSESKINSELDARNQSVKTKIAKSDTMNTQLKSNERIFKNDNEMEELINKLTTKEELNNI